MENYDKQVASKNTPGHSRGEPLTLIRTWMYFFSTTLFLSSAAISLNTTLYHQPKHKYKSSFHSLFLVQLLIYLFLNY